MDPESKCYHMENFKGMYKAGRDAMNFLYLAFD